jgi:type IV secretory pathway VirB4 component
VLVIVLLESGALLAVAHVEGQPFELADHGARNARLRLLNTVYRNLADDNATNYTHLIRHAGVARESPARPSHHDVLSKASAPGGTKAQRCR